jgi:DNA (cytosine-5)-methyltransferase 1
MKEINQLDLFSGIGGFHLGFERAGFKVNSYFSEVDKHAVAVYQHQFKDSTYVGSVTDVRGADLPRIDLITFGSPCQDFSLAGKRKGMGGERSSLITEAIRLIHECRPRVFIWENVKGTFSSNNGADFWAIIQAFANIGGYRLEWQLLNTSWFLPQNRERIYLVGYLAEARGDWGGVFPIGEGIRTNTGSRVKAIGHRGTGGQQGIIYSDNGDSPTISACSYKDPTKVRITDERGNERDGDYIKIKNATQKGYEEATIGDSINYSNPNSKTRNGRVGKGRANTLDTNCSQAVVTPKIIGYSRDAKGKVVDRHLKDEAGTIHTGSGGGGNTDQFVQLETNYNYKKVNETIEQNPNSFKQGEPKMMDLHNRSVKNESPCLVEPHHNNSALFNGYRIRRLTPIECERLQGFPDNHTSKGIYDGEIKEMSNTQRYKQCGNAVTVDVVQAIAEKLHPMFEQ